MSGPTIALEGIAGVYNYGCEAIVRGTAAILRRQWPDCRILYASPRPREDGSVLADLDVERVGARWHVPFLQRAGNKLFRAAGLRYRLKVKRYFDWLDEVDCVLAIGGDIFTMWPGDETAGNFPRAEHARFIMDSGRPLVLWGASVGPFDANPKAVRAYADVLGRMRLITVRERLTRDYLTTLGVAESVRLVADPAFLMTPDVSRVVEDLGFPPDRPVVGVNFSPCAARFAEHEEGMGGFPDRQAAFLSRLLETHDVDVVLIPHVICPWQSGDDDYGYLTDLRTRLEKRLHPRVRLLAPDLGARRTKGVISRCRALVAARMHAAIAGISTAVPTLLVSYSRKALGMSDYVYGGQEWVLPVSSGSEELLDVVGRLLGRAEELHRHLEGRRETFHEDAMKAGRFLKEVCLD